MGTTPVANLTLSSLANIMSQVGFQIIYSSLVFVIEICKRWFCIKLAAVCRWPPEMLWGRGHSQMRPQVWGQLEHLLQTRQALWKLFICSQCWCEANSNRNHEARSGGGRLHCLRWLSYLSIRCRIWTYHIITSYSFIFIITNNLSKILLVDFLLWLTKYPQIGTVL